MQEVRSPNPPVVTGICDQNKYRARDCRSFNLGLKEKYLCLILFLNVPRIKNAYEEEYVNLFVD